jgi:RNAse (barnase) inhibitor barstar
MATNILPPDIDEITGSEDWKTFTPDQRNALVDDWAVQARNAQDWSPDELKALDESVDYFRANALETFGEQAKRIVKEGAVGAVKSLAALPLAVPKLGLQTGKLTGYGQDPNVSSRELVEAAPEIAKMGVTGEQTVQGLDTLRRQYDPFTDTDEEWEGEFDSLRQDVLDRKLPEDPDKLYDYLKKKAFKIAQQNAKFYGGEADDYMPQEFQGGNDEEIFKNYFNQALTGKRPEGFIEFRDDTVPQQGLVTKNQSRSLITSPENLGLLMKFSATRNPMYFEALKQRLGRSRERQVSDAVMEDIEDRRGEGDFFDDAAQTIFSVGGQFPEAGKTMEEEVKALASSPVDMASTVFSFGLGKQAVRQAVERNLLKSAGSVAAGVGTEFLEGALSGVADTSIPDPKNILEQGLMEAVGGGVIQGAGASVAALREAANRSAIPLDETAPVETVDSAQPLLTPEEQVEIVPLSPEVEETLAQADVVEQASSPLTAEVLREEADALYQEETSPIEEPVEPAVTEQALEEGAVDLASMTQEEYADYLAENGTPEGVSMYDALTARPDQRGFTAAQRVEAYQKNKDASKAFTQRMVDFWETLRRTPIAGILARGADSGWTNFEVGQDTHQARTDRYKSYATLRDPLALSQEQAVGFLEALRDAGYNGQVKFPGMGTRALLGFDNVVMHGASQQDAALGEQVARQFFGGDLTATQFGVDRGGKSHSQSLAEQTEAKRKANEGAKSNAPTGAGTTSNASQAEVSQPAPQGTQPTGGAKAATQARPVNLSQQNSLLEADPVGRLASQIEQAEAAEVDPAEKSKLTAFRDQLPAILDRYRNLFEGVMFTRLRSGGGVTTGELTDTLRIDPQRLLENIMAAPTTEDSIVAFETMMDEEFRHRVTLELDRTNPEFKKDLQALWDNLSEDVKTASAELYFKETGARYNSDWQAKHEFFRQYWQDADIRRLTEASLKEGGRFEFLQRLLDSFVKALRSLREGADANLKPILDRLIARAEQRANEIKSASKTDTKPSTTQTFAPGLSQEQRAEFVKTVGEAARSVPEQSRWGDDKVFISDLYKEWSKSHPEATLEDFKDMLTEARGEVQLGRLDLVESLKPEQRQKMNESMIHYMDEQWSLLRIPTQKAAPSAETVEERAAPVKKPVLREVPEGLTFPKIPTQQSTVKPTGPPKAPVPVQQEATQEPETTSLKRAVVDAERVSRGAEAIPTPKRRGWSQADLEAEAQVKANPKAGQELLAKLQANPRALSDTENSLLLFYKVDVRNAIDNASKAVNEATSETDKADAQAVLDQLLNEYNNIDIFSRLAGTEAGRSLNARKMERELLKRDISLASLLQQYRNAKGESLTETERKEVEKNAESLQKAQEKVDKAKADKETQKSKPVERQIAKDTLKQVREERASVKGGVKKRLAEKANGAREWRKANPSPVAELGQADVPEAVEPFKQAALEALEPPSRPVPKITLKAPTAEQQARMEMMDKTRKSGPVRAIAKEAKPSKKVTVAELRDSVRGAYPALNKAAGSEVVDEYSEQAFAYEGDAMALARTLGNFDVAVLDGPWNNFAKTIGLPHNEVFRHLSNLLNQVDSGTPRGVVAEDLDRVVARIPEFVKALRSLSADQLETLKKLGSTVDYKAAADVYETVASKVFNSFRDYILTEPASLTEDLVRIGSSMGKSARPWNGEKVFISELYKEWSKENPGVSREKFNQMLWENRMELPLSRLDLVEALNSDERSKFRESEISLFGGFETLHLVRIPFKEEGLSSPESTAPGAAGMKGRSMSRDSLVGGKYKSQAWEKAKVDATKGLKGSKLAKANKAISYLEKALDKYQNLFIKGVRLSDPSVGFDAEHIADGTPMWPGEYSGKTDLVIDIPTFLRAFAEKPSSKTIQTQVEEEIVHRGVMAVISPEEAARLWEKLPKGIQERVHRTYHFRNILSGNLAADLAPDLTENQKSNYAHEFLRALISDKVFRGRVTESVLSKDLPLARKVMLYLQKYVERLREMLSTAPKAVQQEIRLYEDLVSRALRDMQKGIPRLGGLRSSSKTPGAGGLATGKLDAFTKAADSDLEAESFLNSPSAINPHAEALATIGAEYIENGATTLPKYTKELVKEFGESVRPQAQMLFERSKEIREETQKEIAAEEEAIKNSSDPAKVLEAGKQRLEGQPSDKVNKELVTDIYRAYIRSKPSMKPEDIVSSVTKDIQGIYPNATESDVRVALTDYGKAKWPTKDALKAREAEDLVSIRLMESIDRVKRGLKPLKSGLQRAKPTAQARELNKELRDLMRENKVETTSEAQLTSSRKAIVNRLKNQIEELNRIIEGKAKPGKDRQTVEYDQEINDLIKERNDLKAYVDDLTGPSPSGKWNQQMQRAARHMAEYYRRRIQQNDLRSKVSPSFEATEETERLKQEALDAKAEFDTLRDAAGITQEEQLALQKAALEKKVAELEKQIQTGQNPPEGKKRAKFSELEPLKQQLKSLRSTIKLLEGKTPEAIRAKAATKAIQKSIDELQRRIAQKDTSKPEKRTPVDNEELRSLRQERDFWKEIYDGVKEAENPRRLPEEIALDNLKRRIEKKRYEAEKGIKNQEYLAVPPVNPMFEQRVKTALFEQDQARKEWNNWLLERKLASRGKGAKALDFVGEMLNLSRGIMTSIDMSAVLRQGGFLVGADPRDLAKSFGPMIKAFFHEQAQFEAMEAIKNDPDYAASQRAEVFLSDMNDSDLSKIEEAFFSRWLKYVKGWKGAALGAVIGGATFGPVGAIVGAGIGGSGAIQGSQRAYTTFLNVLRFTRFKAMKNALEANGPELTLEEGRQLGKFINMATGRGSYGLSEKNAANPLLSTIFFAPRLVASRFNLLFGQPLYGGTMRTRKAIAKQYAGFLASTTLALGLLALMRPPEDDDKKFIEFDPRSADFLKARFGNTRLDIFGGLLQVTVLLSRLFTGETKTIAGNEVALRDTFRPLEYLREKMGKELLGDKPRIGGGGLDVIGRFLRSKLSPIAGSLSNIMDGKDFNNEPTSVQKELEKMLVPMSANSILEAMVDQGIPRGTALSILAWFGAGLQTYEPK